MQGAEAAVGGPLHVRDAGNTVQLGDVLFEHGQQDGLEQYDAALVPPLGGWTEEIAEISMRAPLLSEAIFEGYLEAVHLASAPGGVRRYHESYTRGVARCLTTPDFRLKLGTPFIHSRTGKHMVWVQDRVPRSQAAENEANLRTVHICLELFPPQPDKPSLVRKVARALCPCPKGKGGCAHKVCTLYTLYNLERPEAIGWDEPCTSKECNWRKPPESKCKYDRTKPIEQLIIRKQCESGTEERAKPENRLFSERKPHVTATLGGRAVWQPRPADVVAARNRKSPAVVAALAAFLREVDRNISQLPVGGDDEEV